MFAGALTPVTTKAGLRASELLGCRQETVGGCTLKSRPAAIGSHDHKCPGPRNAHRRYTGVQGIRLSPTGSGVQGRAPSSGGQRVGSPRSRVGWSVEELAAQPGDDDVESFVEFGGAVVGGQDGGQGAQPGELGDGQAMQSEAEQVVGFVGIGDLLL